MVDVGGDVLFWGLDCWFVDCDYVGGCVLGDLLFVVWGELCGCVGCCDLGY